MVLASHVIITAYGFWLPNDPRGSWSDFVRHYELLKFGRATKVQSTRSVASAPHDHTLRRAAKRALRHPPVRFTGGQALWIARGFADAVHRCGFRIHACSILWDHAHYVVARHRYSVESVTNQLKGAATRMLTAHQLHPLAQFASAGNPPPSPWSEGLWKVFLSTPQDIHRAIAYVHNNPLKHGLHPQSWSFITPYTPV